MWVMSNLADDVVHLLETAGCQREADDLRAQVAKLASPDLSKRREAAEAIKQRCHPRWLGDLFIPNASLSDWWGALEALSLEARKVDAPVAPGTSTR